jgi:raffinose/stachyose/melibiose transport system substrate-binding protein
MQQLGLKVPTTYEEFVEQLAKAKAAGEQPLMVGSVDKWPALHYWFLIADQKVGKQKLAGILGHKPGATFKTAGFVNSVAELQSWVEKGYLPENFYGAGYDDSIKEFGQGTGVFDIAGSWASNTFFDAMKNNVGVFVMPPPKGRPLLTTDSTNWPVYISAKTKNPDLVAEYMNFISSEHAGQLMATKGSIPAMKMSKPVKASNPVYAALFKAANEIVRSNAEVNYLDAATASMYDVMAGGLQEVLAGQRSPADFIDSLESNYTHP